MSGPVLPKVIITAHAHVITAAEREENIRVRVRSDEPLEASELREMALFLLEQIDRARKEP